MTEEQDKLLTELVQKNGFNYNLHKAAEELQELALVLTQKLTKPDKVDDQEIIDEIGDVEIRLNMLKKIYNPEQINNRITYKLGKYKEWNDSERYKNI